MGQHYDIFVRIDRGKDSIKSPILNLSGSTAEKDSRGFFVIRNNNRAKNQFYYDYQEMPYHELDQQFFNSVVQRMRQIGDFDDEDVAAAFHHYTRTMIDLA